MGNITLCFGVSLSYTGLLPDNAEKIYQTKLKKILSFLYSHQNFSLMVFISGAILEWVEKKHPEAIDLIKELVERKQVEILGGGFYEPLFPLIVPADRVAQIEALTTTIRKMLGKRPRGIFLTESIWDPAMISSLNTCNIEYTLLDHRLIPQSEFRPTPLFSPLVVEDLGRTIQVIPLNQDSKPDGLQSPMEYFDFVANLAQSGESSILSSFFSLDLFLKLIEMNWLNDFISLVQNDERTAFSLPHSFIKSCKTFCKTHIPAACLSDAALWTLEQGVPHTRVFSEPIRPTIRDFLTVYPEALNLYSRMMYTSMLVSQCRGDKVRKKAAREFILKAQNFSVYMYTGKQGITDINLRRLTYKRLLQAEKLIREASPFESNSVVHDFTMNGTKDYLFNFCLYNGFVSLNGGMLFELDLLHTSVNYCLAMKRIAKFDEYPDFYSKKLFVDHLFEHGTFEQYVATQTTESSLFPNIVYSEVYFNRRKKELQLKAEGIWGKDAIPVSLKKKYIFKPQGITVQYILKNSGNIPLKGRFAVEHNFSFIEPAPRKLFQEILVDDKKQKLLVENNHIFDSKVGFFKIQDVPNNTGFLIEPNEMAGLYTAPLYSHIENTQYEAQSITLFWDINLLPDYETEKTLNLTITTSTKSIVAKKEKNL